VTEQLLAIPTAMNDEHPYGVYGRLQLASAHLGKAIEGYRTLVSDRYLNLALVDSRKAIDALGMQFSELTGERSKYPSTMAVSAALATPLNSIHDADVVLRNQYALGDH